MVIRCLHCGSPVIIRGRLWECGYCGDFGSISSPHPSGKAKLMQAATPSFQVTTIVADPSDVSTGSDEENSPHSFSRTGLKDIVCRWGFSENEWAYRDLLVAAFLAVVHFWSVEKLSRDGHRWTSGKVGEWKP